MTTLWLPGPRAPEEPAYPTLGPQLIEFIEDNLVYGPGDLQGLPYRLTDEQKAILCYLYEVHPDDSETAGRRRFKRAALSLAKGLAKTELAALIALCEASSSAPVRTMFEDGVPIFDGQGHPVGTSVNYPYIPMVATTEEQTEDLAYAVAYDIARNSRIADEFDVGLDRIQRISDGGKIQALAGSPDARDGALTSFQHFDETHRLSSVREKKTHQTMLNNIPKRYIADAWTLETTTAYEPGEGSIAEAAHEYAGKVEAGTLPPNRTFFYFHRQASDHYDIRVREQRHLAVLEASGPSGRFRDLGAVVDMFEQPDIDAAYYERVWLNRPVQGSRKAFDLEVWKGLAKPARIIQPGSLVVAAFDGSQFDDSTSLSIREVRTGHSMKLGLWEKPDGARGAEWRVPRGEVNQLVDWMFETFDVWGLYCDPPLWEDTIAAWAGKYGERDGRARVVEWYTNRLKNMVYAVQAFTVAMKSAAISHDGDPDTTRHVGNACKHMTPQFRDEHGQPMFYIEKERPDSPFKMDAAMTEVLSNLARNDAIASGALEETDVEVGGFFV